MSDDKNKVPAKLTALRFAEIKGFNKVNKVAFLKMAGGAAIEKTEKSWVNFCKGKFVWK